MNQPRFIGSARPFRNKALEYVKRGWLKPIPIKARQKGPPPLKYTGKYDPAVPKGLPVTDDVLRTWLENPKTENANIAQHLGFIVVKDDAEYNVLGIDVDHHPEDGKFGGDQLALLEKRYGKLQDTWINSARTNEHHGQRMFLVPKGLQWRGRCAEHIDIISVGHKYSVMYPSYHPTEGQYLWYPPGVKPLGKSVLDEFRWGEIGYDIGVDNCAIPWARDLTILGDGWIDFLSRGGLIDPGPVPMDMALGDADIDTWAGRTLAAANQRILEKRTGETTLADFDGMCRYMRERLAHYLSRIEEEEASHYPLQDAHWELFHLGAEGHTGWATAILEIEKDWRASVIKQDKRSLHDMNTEIYRSKYGALRKLKGKYDEAVKQNLNFIAAVDRCYDINEVVPPGDNVRVIPFTAANPPDQYDMNDDGNAEHWLDHHDGLVLFVSNVVRKWIIWDGSHWIVDEKDVIARFLFRRVKVRQQQLAKKLWETWLKIKGQQGATDIKKLAEKWRTHANNSGMYVHITRALEAAKSVRGEKITVKFEELDKDRRALGFSNGVVRFKTKDQVPGGNWRDVIEIIENSKDLLITRNTGLPYIPLEQQQNTKGYQLFMDFLNRFIVPSIDLEYFQTLCGSVLIGDNSEKIAIFFHGEPDTGKSTMASLMVKALRDYGCDRNPDIFKSAHLNPALASALSMRLMVISEFGDNDINNELFKTITGGDIVTCELKGKNNLVSDIPQFTPLITTNGFPRVPGHDRAFINRLCVIEFKHQATEQEKSEGKATQRELMEHGLVACAAWLVEGAAKSVIRGIRPFPVEIIMATEDFASKLNELGEFAAEWIEACPGGFVSNEDMFFHLKRYADKFNFDIRGWTVTKLTQRLKDLGFEQITKSVKNEGEKTRKSYRGWANVKLVDGVGNSNVQIT